MDRIVRTLEAERLVQRRHGRLFIGARALLYGNAYHDGRLFRHAALPYMLELLRGFDESEALVAITVPVDARIIVLQEIWTPSASLDLILGLGSNYAIEYAASGRAILAHLPTHQVEDLLGTDAARTLAPELDAIRSTGVEVQHSASHPGISAIATPVFRPGAARPVGGLVVRGRGLRERFSSESTRAELRRYAERISRVMG